MAKIAVYSSGRGSQEILWPEAVTIDGHDISDVVSAVLEAKAGDVVTAVIRVQVNEFKFIDTDTDQESTSD